MLPVNDQVCACAARLSARNSTTEANHPRDCGAFIQLILSISIGDKRLLNVEESAGRGRARAGTYSIQQSAWSSVSARLRFCKAFLRGGDGGQVTGGLGPLIR